MVMAFAYSGKSLKKIKDEEIKEYLKKKQNSIWLPLTEPSNEVFVLLKDIFKIHPTTIEDLFSEQTRVKYEEFEDYKVVIFNGIKEIKKSSVEIYNVSWIIGDNFIITVHSEKEETIKELLRNERKIESLLARGEGSLAHYLLDKEVDKYLQIKLEANEELKQLEKEFMSSQNREILTKIYSKQLVYLELRQLSEAMTDICSSLIKLSGDKQSELLRPYFMDVYDHALKTAQGYESMLKRIDGMTNVYATLANMKTNEIMRSLTVLTAIMMPLTVITGVYGMNVKLPIQEHPFAFAALSGGMIFIIALMMILSKRMGWISPKKNKDILDNFN